MYVGSVSPARTVEPVARVHPDASPSGASRPAPSTAPHERPDMLFSALFPLAGRVPTRPAAPAALAVPSAESLRVTASALRAWGAEDDTEELDTRAITARTGSRAPVR